MYYCMYERELGAMISSAKVCLRLKIRSYLIKSAAAERCHGINTPTTHQPTVKMQRVPEPSLIWLLLQQTMICRSCARDDEPDACHIARPSKCRVDHLRMLSLDVVDIVVERKSLGLRCWGTYSYLLVACRRNTGLNASVESCSCGR